MLPSASLAVTIFFAWPLESIGLKRLV
jgi:hypothetical protein